MNVSSLIKALQAVPDLSADVFIGGTDNVSAAGDFTGGASEDLFTATAHGFADDQEVVLQYKSAAGVLTGISAGDRVFVDLVDANTFHLTATAAGSAIANTADGTVVLSPVLAEVTISAANSSTPAGEGPSNPNASPDPGYVTIG